MKQQTNYNQLRTTLTPLQRINIGYYSKIKALRCFVREHNRFIDRYKQAPNEMYLYAAKNAKKAGFDLINYIRYISTT